MKAFACEDSDESFLQADAVKRALSTGMEPTKVHGARVGNKGIAPSILYTS
jgi:hypothetical protein